MFTSRLPLDDKPNLVERNARPAIEEQSIGHDRAHGPFGLLFTSDGLQGHHS